MEQDRGLVVALRYHSAGLPPLEVAAGRKAPVPTGRTGRGGVDYTEEEIRHRDWTGNIAVRMPADVIGIDIDAYKGGLETFARLVDKLGPLPPTVVSHSNRNDGSGIKLFRVPAGSHWVTGLPGIEIIQREHRYALVAPSTHPDGRVYGWWDEQAEEALTVPPLVEDLPELPWAWVTELGRSSAGADDDPARIASLAEVQEFIQATTEADRAGYMSVILEHWAERRLAGYSRHDTMTHCLTWGMECCRAGVLTAVVVIPALAEVWTAAHSDPRRAEALSSTRVTEFDAMLRWAVGRVNAKSAEEMDVLHESICGPTFNVPPVVEEPVVEPTAPTDAFAPITFGRLPEPFVVPAVEWHASALLARPTHGELAGEEKSLKTYFGLALDVGLAAGLPVLGRWEVPSRQRVVLLVGEGGRGPWLRRLEAVCHAYGIEPGDIADHVRFSTDLASVVSTRFVEGVRHELETFGPAVVHLDPWYAYAGSSDARQVTEVGAVLAYLGELCDAHGASLVINHHYNRTGSAGLRAITGAGHAEWVDSWFLLRHRVPAKPATGEYRLRLDVGSRQWGGGAYDVDFDIEPLTGKVQWRTAEVLEGGDEEMDPFAPIKAELLRIGRRARAALTRQAWVGRCKRRRTDALAAFDELVEAGEIVVVATMQSGTHVVSTYQVASE